MASLTACLGPERIIKSDIVIEAFSPAAFTFQCMTILTTETTGGPGGAASPVDAADRIHSYNTFDELAAEWDPASAVYRAGLSAFAQSPGPTTVQVGFVASYSNAEMDALNECDPGCYGYTPADLRDDAAIVTLAAWFEASGCKVLFVDSNDPLTEDRTDMTNIAEQLKQAGYNRTAVFYHTDNTQYLAAAALASALSNDLDQGNSAYTLKFTQLAGIPAATLTSTTVQNVTGFVPGSGLDPDAGHYANTVVCHCDRPILVEGNMASGLFFDLLHYSDWLQKRVQEGLCDLALRNRVPYSQEGYEQQRNVVARIMRQGQLGGFIAEGEFQDADFLPGFEIITPNVANATNSQIANRQGQCVQYTARLVGAIHYFCAQGTATVFADSLLETV